MNPAKRERSHGELLAALRSTLDQAYTEAEQLTAAPPWAQIQAGMARARRRHRRRVTLRIGAAVLAATAVSAGVVAAVHTPSPPADSRPATRGASQLDDGHVRGSLRSDKAWLEALQTAMSTDRLKRHFGSFELPDPPAPKDVHVLFAGDVGAYRIAVVEAGSGSPAQGHRLQTVYTGNRGAAVEGMVDSTTQAVKDVVSWYSDPISNPKNSDTVILVLAPSGNVVQLREPPAIDASAKVTARVRTLIPHDQVYSELLTEPGQYALAINGGAGEIVYGAVTDRGVYWVHKSGLPVNPPVIEPLPPARGGIRPPDDGLEHLATDAFGVSWQPNAPGEFRVLAIEQAYRKPGRNPVRAAVGLLTLPSGARVLVTGVQTRMMPRTTPREDSWLDTAQLLPAGNSDDLSVAWRMPANNVSQPGHSSGWAAAMGPVGTRTVQWVHKDGTVSSGPAENTLAVIGTPDVTSARFIAADGTRLGSTGVLDPPWTVAAKPTSPENPEMIPAITAVTGERPRF
jgi:hypothetical protein